MPGKVKVKIISGRNLPVMDRSSDTTDAYVEIKLGSTTYKTDVCRKSLHPQWNSEWYRFEVDDSELQDEPLQIRLMDHDTYSANDAIGKVYLDLNPLLLPGAFGKYGHGDANHDPATNSVMSGWIPVYDTMHGIRGEVNVTVKVELFSDFNRFRQSSCGIHFFCSKSIPHGFCAQNIHGFVEELVVNDDPEYQWIDKIRTPRASNEARQTLFFKLSGELQRKIGLKALDLGGNAVIGYCQCFDLEGESGIVARGIGTAVTLVRVLDLPSNTIPEVSAEERAQNYLKFLRSQSGFFLNQNQKKSQIIANLPTLDILNPRYKHLPKHYTKLHSHLRSSRSNPSLGKHSVKTLLKQEANRGTPGSGLTQKLKNFKYSSQSALSKKMIALKAKLGDTGIGEETDSDSASYKRSQFKKAERSGKNSSVMAELLARSVIHAHNSLTSILESQDCESEKSDQSEENSDLHKTISEPVLSLTSLNDSSSSESDESSDETSDKNNVEFDTISEIIKNVKIEEKNYGKKFLKQMSLPVFDLCESESDGKVIDRLKSQKDEQKYHSDDHGDQNNFNGSLINQPDQKYHRNDQGVHQKHNIVALMNETVDQNMVRDDKQNHNGSLINQQADQKDKEDFQNNQTSVINNEINDQQNKNGQPDQNNEDHDDFDHFEYLEVKRAPIAETEMTEDELTYKQSLTPKTILPSVPLQPKEKKLVKTAIQVLLLDKANILGTYTPPISPLKETSFFSTPPKMPRSHTAISLDRYVSKDTVLGAPFASMQDIQKSDSELRIEHNKDNFIRLLSHATEPESASHENLTHKRKFSFLHLTRRKSHEPHSNLKKVKSDEIHRRRFTFLRRHRNKSESERGQSVKKQGLLNTALGNMVFETVQDILVTSKKEPPDPTPPRPPVAPVNTEIELGVCDCNNKINQVHASLTHSPRSSPIAEIKGHEPGHHRAESMGVKLMQSPAKLNAVPCIYRRSSDSDLSITPKGNSLTGSDRSTFNPYIKPNLFFRSANIQDFDMLEYPFLTMTKYPPGFIIQIGGAVSARSVKLLERISNLKEPESRDTWWSEIRMEIRSHARALNCNAVLGYIETTSICEDVCVLSANGTAAVVGIQSEPNDNVKWHSKDIFEEKENKMPKIQEVKTKTNDQSPEHDTENSCCSLCHLPYNSKSLHNRSVTLKCTVCRIGKVPDILIATIAPPDGTPTFGRGCFVQAFVCRPLKDLRGELNAKEISDGLPFLEYELHRSLINKSRIKGMNSIFGLKISISIGDKQLIGLATGTAMFLPPLPTPVLPKLTSDRGSDEKKLLDLKKSLTETVRRNREVYQLKNVEETNVKILSDEDSDEESASLDLSIGNKDCCILEVDDPQDVELLKALKEEPSPPNGFHVVNTEFVPGLEELEIVKNLQMFKQIYRAKFVPPYKFEEHFQRLLQSVYFKLRKMIPCALCDLQFRVELPESDEIQLCVLGMALGLGEPNKGKIKRKNTICKKNEEDMIFNLEEDQENGLLAANKQNSRQKSPLRNRNQIRRFNERHGVDITPLTYVPGGKIEHYLGNLNFFFIRETTSIREEGGLSGFIHSFVNEVLAIVRAHVTALGGNAMVSYFLTECVLNHNLHKNQGQCLINVGGDVVVVSYFKEDT